MTGPLEVWAIERNRWVIQQAWIWMPVLALQAISSLGETGAALRQGGIWTGWSVGILVLALTSYVRLVLILRSGRTAADLVTMGRFALILVGMAGLFALRLERLALWFCLVLGVSLDLVDGWVARRFGASEEGSVLDMETDQLTTLCLGLLAHERLVAGGAPLWVALAACSFLLLPALKYGFALALRNAPRANEPNPSGNNSRARRICATVLVGLLVATLPVLGHDPRSQYVRSGVGVVLALLLCSSFWGDVRHVLARSTNRKDSDTA